MSIRSLKLGTLLKYNQFKFDNLNVIPNMAETIRTYNKTFRL